MASRQSEFVAGVKDTFPMIVGAIPFGIIFGAAAVDNGISPLAVIGMSLFVFAGSSQFIAANLVAQNTALLVIVFTTLIVNMRHALYSASLAPYAKNLPQKWLLPLGFWLTDETYAIVIRRFQSQESPHQHWYWLGSAVSMYTNWQLCTVIGVIAGTQLTFLGDLGLDFAMTVTFIGIVVPRIITRPMLVCAVAAGVASILFNGLEHNMGLMVAAFAGIAAGMAAEAWHGSPQKEKVEAKA